MLAVVNRAMAKRLRAARISAGHETGKAAAELLRRCGAPLPGTYLSWENGNRAIPAKWYRLLCNVFRINQRWLETGEGPMEGAPRAVARIEGKMVAAGEIIHNLPDEVQEVVTLPEFATGQWIGYRVAGEANSPVFMDGDILFVRPGDGPDPETLVNKLCIVTTPDGRRWARTLLRGARASLFTLLAINGAMMPDVEVVDATPVKHIMKA